MQSQFWKENMRISIICVIVLARLGKAENKVNMLAIVLAEGATGRGRQSEVE